MTAKDLLCDYIARITFSTYEILSRFFSYRLSMSEIGITDIFIFKLFDWSLNNYGTRKNIIILKSEHESIYGNDIDIYFECDDDSFVYYALQAKVMSSNGAYKDLNKYNKDKTPQWDKQIEHENKFDSKTFYLFYNGEPNINKYQGPVTKTDCYGTLEIHNLGMGIVETRTVKQVVLDVQENRKENSEIHLSDFMPDKMDSIRKLFCCECLKTGRRYSYEEIHKTAPYHKIKADLSNLPLSNEIESSQQYDIAELGLAPTRIIIRNK